MPAHASMDASQLTVPIPYLSADHACYAFQLPAYTEHFSCISVDLPGSGESDKPAGPYGTDAVVQGLFPFCFTPEMYDQRPEFAQSLADFVRSRPAAPLEAFLSQTDAVIGHDASAVLGDITAPTLVTFGAHDLVTSTGFAARLTGGIAGSELVVFDHLSHAGLHEDADAFNGATLDFLLSQSR
jgi:pimeloyl-ACP methyl ester carboxylesterase